MRATFLNGKITVLVQPFFWLMAGMFGFSLGHGSTQEVILWTVVVAFSVLFHEAGHAATCLAFGSGADIVLQGFGGTTRPRDPSTFGTWKRAALDLAGCAAGGMLAAASFGVLYLSRTQRISINFLAFEAALALLQVNIWFSIFNLLPISPMDGGKLVQGLLKARFGVGGQRVGHTLGLILGAVATLWFFLRGATYGALVCGVMATGEGRALRRSLSMTKEDQDETVRAELTRAAELWSKEQREEAVAALTALRRKTGAGLTYAAAGLQLAVYFYLLERYEEAFTLFKETPQSDMSRAARQAYADVARRLGDFERALSLSKTIFHDAPGPQTAASAAIAAAGLGDARETVAWLKTALRQGLAKTELSAPEFNSVRNSQEFRELISGLSET